MATFMENYLQGRSALDVMRGGGDSVEMPQGGVKELGGNIVEYGNIPGGGNNTIIVDYNRDDPVRRALFDGIDYPDVWNKLIVNQLLRGYDGFGDTTTGAETPLGAALQSSYENVRNYPGYYDGESVEVPYPVSEGDADPYPAFPRSEGEVMADIMKHLMDVDGGRRGYPEVTWTPDLEGQVDPGSQNPVDYLMEIINSGTTDPDKQLHPGKLPSKHMDNAVNSLLGLIGLSLPNTDNKKPLTVGDMNKRDMAPAPRY